jgi:hypothetical protein
VFTLSFSFELESFAPMIMPLDSCSEEPYQIGSTLSVINMLAAERVGAAMRIRNTLKNHSIATRSVSAAKSFEATGGCSHF